MPFEDDTFQGLDDSFLGRGDGLESQDDEAENLRDAPSAQPQRTRM